MAEDSAGEPERITDLALRPVLEQLIAREPIFHRPEHGTTRAEFEAMTASEFWEVGASGRLYARSLVLDLLEERYAQPREELWEVSDACCQQLAPELYMLTYTLLQDHTRRTRRTTLWRREAAGWQIVFHQGTLVASG